MYKLMIYILVITFAIPFVISICYMKNDSAMNKTEIENKNDNTVEKTEMPIQNHKLDVISKLDVQVETKHVEKTNPLEEYVKGVVAAEMPVSFELEALKAQAVAARTYAVRHNSTDYEKLYQAYSSQDDLKKHWGNMYETNYKKISTAVDSTQGEVLEYNNEVIEAVFHSTSCGVTANSEDVWTNKLPYLKSVDSKYDCNAPSFIANKTFEIKSLIKILNDKYKTQLTDKNFMSQFKLGTRTASGYLKNVLLCGKSIDAMEFRMLLGLRSTDFTFSKQNSNIVFTTKGYGHGAGMSQYGANFMAKDGFDYKQILKHYYSGVEITKL